MPGATTARLVSLLAAMPENEFMIPQTVPNNPTNGRDRAGGREQLQPGMGLAQRAADGPARHPLQPGAEFTIGLALPLAAAPFGRHGTQRPGHQVRRIIRGGREPFGRGRHAQSPRFPAQAAQRGHFLDDHSPAGNGGQGQQHHHRFHHDIGGEKQL